MKINIRSSSLPMTESLKSYVEKKLGKLDKYFDHIQEIAVDLEVNDTADHNSRQAVMVTVWVSGSVMRAQESSKDMYASIDLVFSKLEKQLVKYKEKLKYRTRQGEKKHLVADMVEGQSKRKKVRVVRQKNPVHQASKPLSVEDAADLLLDENLGFLVFRNAKNEAVNVVYVAEDGTLGLIEP